ncbi:MAG: glycosyltransferase [Gammaproteobacteria bacterium]
MNRPELLEALLSVEKQTYTNIEIILVDATGKGLDRHKSLALNTALYEVGDQRPLNRPAAANLALASAHSSFMLFLDEDDWIAPNHIEMLVECLQANPTIGVAYSSTQKTTPAGIPSGEAFRIDYDHARLRRDNFIPIHSAMFRKSLIDQGCRFDENLEIFEDWDFWLQLAQLMPFIHIDEITAFYRQGGESNTASSDPSTRYQIGNPIAKARVQVFSKWLSQWTGAEINETLGTLDQTAFIETLHKDIKRLNAHSLEAEQDKRQLGRQLQEIEGRFNSELRSVNHKLNKANQGFNRRTAELNDAKNHVNRLTNEYQLLINSLSWKLTKPIRFAKRQLLALGAGKVKQQLQPNQAKVSNDKEEVILCNLDIPSAAQNEFPEQLSLQGWACSKDGIEKIEAFIDGKLALSFGTGISRPDIAENYPDIKDAFTAGFFQEIPLPDLNAGKHELVLTFTDKAENSRSLTQEFSLFKNSDLYNTWYWRNTPETQVIEELRAQSLEDESTTLFHLVLSQTDDEEALLHTLCSIAEQAHQRWMLHVVGQSTPAFERTLENAGIATSSTQVHFVPSLNKLLADLSERDGWTLLLQSGETLAPQALWEMNQALQNSTTQLLYCDHDKSTLSGKHFDPCFTPQWAPNHLYASNYVGDIFAVHNACLVAVKGLDLSSLAWRFEVLLTLSETPLQISRLAKMLWSAPQESSQTEKLAAETEILRTHLQEQDAQVIERDHDIRQVRWPLSSQPKVSIIIPTMGKLSLIQPCIDSMLELTTYKNYEVVILDNSRGKNPEGISYLKSKNFTVVECNEAFNWARLNNVGVKNSTGELYLFLNDDIEIIDPLWLEEMVRQAIRPEVGTVGALLYYPNGALQHTGVLLVNYGGGGIHLLHKRMPSDSIYRYLHETTREVSANTGACLMVSREKFEAIDGFDEELAVVGNDVDLCLRLLDKGYRNIWSPDVKLIHHESISRKTSVPKENEKSMWKRWSKRFVAGDEFYNPNLSAEKGDFTLQVSGLPSVSTDSQTTLESRAESKGFQPGVNLIGYTRAEMGIGEGARSDAKALDAADEPFGIICFQSGNPSRMTDLSWQHKEIENAPYDVTLLHINPDHAFQAISELPSEHFNDHYRIGYWAWELPEIPEAWVETFVHFDEIWVPSSFVQDAVAMRSPIPVVRIPHAVEVKVDSSLKRQDFGLPEEAFLFLAMFDTYSMPARKNPFGAIDAFKRAFAKDDLSSRLVLKVNNPTPDSISTIKEAIGEHRNILVLDKVYSRQEVNALISNTDCFVSLHRSEGFGFGPAEAMALGKAVLATNWSGNTDYMRPNNCMPIDYELITIQEDFGPYKKGQVWAEPDVKQAAEAMQSLAKDPALSVALGSKARSTIEAEFSPRVVGEMMRKRLQAIRSMSGH